MLKFRRGYFILFYLLTVNLYSQNLITNGDFGIFDAAVFSPPPIGYKTNLTQVPYTGPSLLGAYAITNDPFIIAPGSLFSSFDITDGVLGNGTGNMMFVDADKNRIFWKQDPPLTLDAGKTYTFTYWIRNVNQTVSGGSPQPKIRYNPTGCTSCTIQIFDPLLSKTWTKVSYQITPTLTQLVAIELSTVAAAAGGNNFVIDDISLIPPVLGLSVSTSEINPSCINTTDGSIAAYPNSGVAPFIYNLTGSKTDTNSTGIFTGLASGSYVISVTDSDIIPVTVVSSTINLVAPSNIALSVSPEGCILSGSPVTLTATNGSGTYKWTASTGVSIIDTDNVVIVNPLVNTTYTAESTISKTGINLITNEGFEDGTSGFFSDYAYSTLNTSGSKFAYGIVGNPNNWSNNFINSTDKSGSGKMLVASGATTVNTVIWSQSIPVTNNSVYSFSFWAQNVTATTPAQFQVLINGFPITISPISATNGSTSGWTEIKGTWNSSTTTVAKIEIINTNIQSSGNDFALDDILFSTTTPKTCLLSTQKTVNIGGTSPITTFSYATPICKSDLNPSPISALGFLSGGIYSESTGLLKINSTTGVIDLASSTTGTYTIKYSLNANPNTCQSAGISTFEVTLNSTLEAPKVISPTNYCIDSTTTLLTALPLPDASLNWYGTDGTGGTASTTAPTPSSATRGSLIYYVSQSIGVCESPRAAIVVTINTPPNAGILSGNQNKCLGLTTTFSSTSLGGVWSSSDLSIASINSVSGLVTGVTIGTSVISYTVLGSEGCPNAIATRDVTFSAGVIPGILSGTQNVCLGLTTTFTSSVSGGIWSSSNSNIATVDATGVVTGVLEGTTLIIYTILGTGGCSDVLSNRNAIVTAIPRSGTLNGTQNVCLGFTTSFSSSETGGTWSSSDSNIAVVDSATGLITGVSIGTATITYTVLGLGGCSNATETRDVTFSAGVIPGIVSGTQNICFGLTTNFTSNVSGGTWSSTNSNIATVDSSGVVTGVSAGTAKIIYTISGTGGCSVVSSERIVIVTAAPIAGTLNGTQNVCLGFSTLFSSSVVGGTWSSSDSNIALVDSITGLVTGVITGTTTIIYAVTGTGGCSDAFARRDVTFNSDSNAGTVSGISNVCVGLTTTFSSSILGGTWSSLNSNIASVNSTNGIITGVSGGEAKITYTIIPTSGQCAKISTVPIVVNPNITPIFSLVESICSGSLISPLPTTSSNNIMGLWSPALDNISTKIYTFTPNLGQQCATTQTATIVVNPVPEFTVSKGCVGNDYILNVTQNNLNNVTYKWNNSSGEVIGTSSSIKIIQKGNYSIEVNEGECKAIEDNIDINNVYCIIPKGISPNNDDKNDTFDLSDYNVYKLEIFNRYGIKVYSKSNYKKEWNGSTDSGQELPDATYYYVLEFESGKSKTGWVYLNRQN